MGNKASKVTTNYAVPGSALAGIKLMYGVRDGFGGGVELANFFLDVLRNIL